MRRSLMFALLASCAIAGTLRAQNDQDPRPADSLRVTIQERFSRQVREQLGLTEDQAARMRATALSWVARRRDLDLQERDLRGALAGQMRPGVAADQDSVARLTDALLSLRIQQVQTYRDELKEMTYLTPVQRAQFFILRDRLLKQIERAREDTSALPLRRRLRP